MSITKHTAPEDPRMERAWKDRFAEGKKDLIRDAKIQKQVEYYRKNRAYL